ncbi:hypothetical protein GMA11_07920 [Granulicatella sp. zg-ZJ]|uniref:FtsB family cell division protein n=1 Tax=unclassified Granulicatella TaxID=2630493 RepID=UPI0013BF31C9|nr:MULTISPECIES: septum formation initiator family protein [unclassified Granulicatella]MBS4750196.1 septum formation initiator family protein [Carnobacteriaceae bacterium zg-ZUI78]NEW63317.1 hypothetical protein [Granulicatella sp. zg-ZJ]NEW66260.1 hypothetical protein [Granulicatella sp. zg-84]QMI85651.1 septum formation initiator family protein [Carnobacteriaceae bacterium zg-84]
MAKVNKNSAKHATNRVFIWLLISSVLAGLLVFQIWQNVKQNQEFQQTLKNVQADKEKAEVQKMELQAQVDLLNDDDYILKLARSRGFMGTKDEIIFNIPSENMLLKQEQKREEQENKE